MNRSFARTLAAGGDVSPWLKNGRFTSPAAGCLRVCAGHAKHRALVSCAIHGDETAPIELVDRLIDDIRDGVLMPCVDLLLVVGNPAAIDAGKRCVDRDMNRLFDGAWQQFSELPEAFRAHELEEISAAFLRADDGLPCWHLDLHTTIRASRIERFAIANAATQAELSNDLCALLQCGGVDAIVFHPASRGTFSAFTSRIAGVQALTVELGQGRPFGGNAPASTAAFESALRDWLATAQVPAGDASELRLFEVTRSIIRTDGDFEFYLPDAMENFTILQADQLLAHTDGGEIRALAGEAILFPNRNVAPGLRAGLLVRELGGH